MISHIEQATINRIYANLPAELQGWIEVFKKELTEARKTISALIHENTALNDTKNGQLKLILEYQRKESEWIEKEKKLREKIKSRDERLFELSASVETTP